MELTEKEFCEMYSSYYGERIDSIKQLTLSSFNGVELKEFIEHCIDRHLSPGPCHLFESCKNKYKNEHCDENMPGSQYCFQD